ncbi:ComEC/Rec2 family competence protein [Oribacterium asaccharolyticum]|uniref:ComEC/Rec2 family competence protein n=1 Tax=Oribacterium asaccharolyticum TaxID=1501332 RepID=UPI0028E9F16A|nr:MBL fold metallo-hydrolase [Oribacterium asaccharolyticum]
MNKRFGSLVLAVGMSFLLALPAFAEESSTGTIYGNTNTEASLSQDKTSGGNAPIYVRNGETTPTYTDSTIGLGGAKITMIKGNESGQQISIVIESNDGQLIVVDGGLKTNAPYLSKFIKARGGKVSAWLLTHPHEDHVGALSVILEQQKVAGHPDYYNIDPGQIYFSFAPYPFYEQYEQSYRLPMIKEVMDDLAAYPAEKKHENSERGTTFSYGNVSVEVLNTAYSIPIDSGNNSSICYMITINGKKLLITGDLPYEAAGKLLEELPAEKLKADIVQMAHHGQHGGSFAFYSTVNPRYALWPSSKELWDKRKEPFTEDQETYTIALTKFWMNKLGVEKNYVMADGNWVLE